MIESHIPSHFDNFEQRQLSRGIETKSRTNYKEYEIVLRCYTGSGISAKIVRINEQGKRIQLREKYWNFHNPLELLNKQKQYIDEYGNQLVEKYNKIVNK